MIQQSKPDVSEGFVYQRIFRNRAFLFLWGGQTVSTTGDVFFNLAVMWVVYVQSGSALQTAIVQVIWHLSSILFGPIAGVWADRWNRKYIMIIMNVLSAAVVGLLAAWLLFQHSSTPLIIFITVLILNSLNSFLMPARVSILPDVVGSDLMATASGLFTSAGQTASFLGAALAGLVIASLGTVWALVVDAVSFLLATFAIVLARLPRYEHAVSDSHSHFQFGYELIEGWKSIANQPVIRVLVWLSMLINISSFIGPLMPVLIRQQLHSGATVYGTIMAVSVLGGAIGGALTGRLERYFGAGPILILGWALAGACVIGMALSTSVFLTTILETVVTFGMTVGAVSMGAMTTVFIPKDYRGRVQGITGGLSVIAIPVSSLLGGWLTDMAGPTPLFVFAGIWTISVATIAWLNRSIRMARI